MEHTVVKFVMASVGALVLGFAATDAKASLITWEFTGNVTQVFSSSGGLPSSLQGGSTFTGTFTYDDTAPDFSFTDPFTGNYAALRSIHVLIDGTFDFNVNPSSPGQVLVVDGTGNANDDLFLVSGFRPGPTSFDPSIEIRSTTIQLYDAAGETAITGDQLAGLSLSLSEFDVGLRMLSLNGRDRNSQGFEIRGQLTSLEQQSATVPEPASLAVWSVMGLVGLSGALWRRRRVALAKP
jgi:hypothetical protein